MVVLSWTRALHDPAWVAAGAAIVAAVAALAGIYLQVRYNRQQTQPHRLRQDLEALLVRLAELDEGERAITGHRAILRATTLIDGATSVGSRARPVNFEQPVSFADLVALEHDGLVTGKLDDQSRSGQFSLTAAADTYLAWMRARERRWWQRLLRKLR